MSDLLSRLAELEPEFLERKAKFEKKFSSNPELDNTGILSTRMKGSIRFISLCDYKLRHNINSFRKNLAEASRLRKSLFDRRNLGEPIDDSFVTMHSFGYILDAYASGDFQLGEDFARVIGGREALEKYHDHPFDYAFGYALKAIILDDKDHIAALLSAAEKEVKRADVKYFQAYVDGLYALWAKDNNAFEFAMDQLLKDHRKLCRVGGTFDDNDDEVLCFWGLGLINLARHKGLDVTIDDEFLPEELII